MVKRKPTPAANYTKGFMCQTDFEHELGCASGGTTVYPSVEDIKKNRRCADECGIVEVNLHFVKVVQKGTGW